MITTDLKDPMLNKMRDKFNEMLATSNDVLFVSHYHLQDRADNEFSALEWREFKLHPAVSAYLDEELAMIMKDKAFELAKLSGNNNSTATTQALTSALNFLDKKKSFVQNPTVFIYSFVPLSEMEAKAPNVRTLENIPTEIRDAIVHIK